MHLTTQAHETYSLIRAEESRIDAEGALAFKEAMREATREAGPPREACGAINGGA